MFFFLFWQLIIQSGGAPWGLDVALLSEAHGLVTDLLLESSTMPPQLASGLKALATLLSPPSVSHSGPSMDRRPRHTLPHVALSDVQYASDTEEIPYTGETLLHLSKVNESIANLEKMVPSSFSSSSVVRHLFLMRFRLSIGRPLSEWCLHHHSRLVVYSGRHLSMHQLNNTRQKGYYFYF